MNPLLTVLSPIKYRTPFHPNLAGILADPCHSPVPAVVAILGKKSRLGDVVLEEIIVRLIARQALAALDWEEGEEEERKQKAAKETAEGEEGAGGAGGAGGGEAGCLASSPGPAGRAETSTGVEFGVPAALRPLSWRLDFATRLAVSNANLRAVREVCFCWSCFLVLVSLKRFCHTSRDFPNRATSSLRFFAAIHPH